MIPQMLPGQADLPLPAPTPLSFSAHLLLGEGAWSAAGRGHLAGVGLIL